MGTTIDVGFDEIRAEKKELAEKINALVHEDKLYFGPLDIAILNEAVMHLREKPFFQTPPLYGKEGLSRFTGANAHLFYSDELISSARMAVALWDVPIGTRANFREIQVRELSMQDSFMTEHTPVSLFEAFLKNELVELIANRDVYNYWMPLIPPSYAGWIGDYVTNSDIRNGGDVHMELGDGELFFRDGYEPMNEQVTFDWWEEMARKHFGSYGGRIGTESDYIAFCGDLIKHLVEEEAYEPQAAWHEVCDDSEKLLANEEICAKYGLNRLAKVVKAEGDKYSRYQLRDYVYGSGKGQPIYDFDVLDTCDSLVLRSSVGWVVFDNAPPEKFLEN